MEPAPKSQPQIFGQPISRMSKRKRLSAKEKAVKLLEIYHISKDVFTLQQIEKAGVQVGVVMNTIKDINQDLVNDGQVETDKIGSQCFFW